MLDKTLIRIDVFRYAMDKEVKDNLSEYVLSTVSNMLALYYASDTKLQKIQQDILHYAQELAAKLHRYLKEEIILDETFDVAMNLFAVAISPEMPEREAPPSLTKDKKAIIDVANNICFSAEDISEGERKSISEVLGDVLDSPNADEILSLIASKPEIVRSLIHRKTKSKDIVDKLSDMANMSGKTSNITTDFVQFSGLIICGLLGFAANMAAIHSIDAVAAVTVIPSAIISLKYGTRIGEIIGNGLASFEKGFKEASNKFAEMIQEFAPDFKTSNLSKSPKIEPAHSHKNELDTTNLKLDHVITNVANHLSTKEDLEKSIDIDKLKQKSKTIGRDAVS